MKKIIFIMFLTLFTASNIKADQKAYDFKFENINGGTIDLAKYKNKVMLIVNVASRCGYTPQYEDLQTLWKNYKKKDLIVIGIPTNNFKQEPGDNTSIKKFCETNFGVDFLMSNKIDVIGKNAHPFYQWAKKSYGLGAIPKWNFHKIVIDKNGVVINTFASFTKPTSKKMIKVIEKAIKS